MTQVEILENLKRFTIPERLSIIEAAVRLIREDLQQEEQPSSPKLSSQEARKRQLAAAAKALREDYTADDELTAFTALDSEDFHAQR